MASTLSTLRSTLGFEGKVGVWKFLALVFALLNLKSLPFVWHIRLIKSFFTHLPTSRLRLATHPGPSTLFQPLITTSRSGLLECDYNLHKSNSTYFSDFDVNRLELLVLLGKHGMDATRKELELEEKDGGVKGRFGIHLGGVSCQFRREIKPYEKYEVWTRVLGWDHKWFYMICHFVEPGMVEPGGYTLQPWRKGKGKGRDKDGEKESNGSATTPSSPHPAIFAAGIAKYVSKKGRLTISPERVLRASNLLPPRPQPADQRESSPAPSSSTPPSDSTSTTAAATTTSTLDHTTPGLNTEEEDIVVASLNTHLKDGDGDEGREWTWERVEEERIRGLRVAEAWGGMEVLSGELRGEGEMVLGRF